jgi:hypothetical protein
MILALTRLGEVKGWRTKTIGQSCSERSDEQEQPAVGEARRHIADMLMNTEEIRG